MKLHYTPGACSLAVHIALREAGAPVELVKVDLRTKTTADGQDFRAINPKGYVPALMLNDGQVMTEASALLQYVADHWQGANLLSPVGTPARYKELEWIGFISTEIHKGFSPLWHPTTPEATRQTTIENLSRRFDLLEPQLGQTEYLTGSAFRAPDAYAFVVLSWANHLKVDLGRWPNIQAFLQRVASRAKVQEAMKAEGLI